MKDEALFYQRYRKQMAPLLGDALMTQAEFAAMCSEALRGMERIETDGSGQRGCLYYRCREEDGMLRCSVPVFGYEAPDEKTMVRLFQKLGATVVKDKPCEFSLRLYSGDRECIQALHLMQFGTIAEKGVLQNRFPVEAPTSGWEVRVLHPQEIRARWKEIWAATAQIVRHLQQSPIFYPGEEFTEEVYRDFYLDDAVHLLAAERAGQIIGIIEWNEEQNPLISDKFPSVNVGEAFVDPAYRASGLAPLLLQTAQQQSRNAGAEFLWVEHGTANPNARGFWNRYFQTYEYELIRTVTR